MVIAYWIVAGLLALAYLAAGAMKALRAPEALVKSGIGWAPDVPLPLLRVIGVLEVLGAIGVILPPLTGIAPVLAPIAAFGLVLLQLGAIGFHVRRGEAKALPTNLVLLVLALVVAILGFLVWS